MLVLENLENSDWQLECGQIRQRGARLLASAQWADCSFLLGQDKAPQKAHRLLLAMASPVFQAMFYGPLAEHDAPIPLPDIQPEVFMQLLQYIYTDQIDLKDHTIAIELYFAAQKYMLKYLQDLCTTYLSGNLSPTNACRIYEFAYSIGDTEIECKSLKVIKAETKSALSDSSFNHLSLATVISIFSMDDITIDSELDLFKAADRYYLAHQELACEDIETSYEETEDNGAQSEETATFRFTVNNFTNLKDNRVSPPYYLHGLPWAIMVQQRQGKDGKKQLAVFLQCNTENNTTSWSCQATSELRLINHKPYALPLERKLKHLFCSKENDRGWSHFMEWDYILDSNKGYTKDDSITLEALVIAEEPHGIPLSMKKLSEMKDVSIRTLIKQIRFLTLNPHELADYEPESSLLTEQDIHAIMMNLVSKKTYVPLPKKISKCKVTRKPHMKKK